MKPCCRFNSCSFSPSATDAALFEALGKEPNAESYPNVARFFKHIASFSKDARGKWPAVLGGVSAQGTAPAAASKPAAAAAGPVKKAAAPAPADDDEDVDLFGEDGDAAAKKASAAVAKPAPEEKKKKEKAPVIAKTSVIYEVKPLEAGQGTWAPIRFLFRRPPCLPHRRASSSAQRHLE